MALRIIRATDPIRVEQLIVAIYAPPGLGKTSLCFTADAPLLLDFDRGAHRSRNRGESVPVESWSDVVGITAADIANYKTICIDTAGRALDQLAVDIIHRNPKMGRGGALTLQGYGQLATEFAAWTKMIRSFGKDMILVAHSSEDKQGDDIVERIDMVGKSKQEVYKAADAMGRLSMVNGQRILTFSPSDTAFGKNPGQLDALQVPAFSQHPGFLGDVIRRIKEVLNGQTEKQRALQEATQSWLDRIAHAETPADFTALAVESKDANESIRQVVKAAILKAATEANFTFDKERGEFVGPPHSTADSEAPEADWRAAAEADFSAAPSVTACNAVRDHWKAQRPEADWQAIEALHASTSEAVRGKRGRKAEAAA